MPFRPFTLDESVEQAGAAQRIKEGHYLMEIVGVKPTPEDYDKTESLIWSLKTVEGPDAPGQVLNHWTIVGVPPSGKANRFALGDMLRACGFSLDVLKRKVTDEKTGEVHMEFVPIPNYAMFVGMATLLAKHTAGKQVHALVADNEFNGKINSKIANIYPPETFTVATGANGAARGDDAAYLAEAEKMFPGAQVV